MELLKNKQIIENRIVQFYTSKKFGKIRSPRPAPLYSKTPLSGKQLAPLLGENSLEILKELKFTKKEIDLFLNEAITSI